jgi:hypothetical protein
MSGIHMSASPCFIHAEISLIEALFKNGAYFSLLFKGVYIDTWQKSSPRALVYKATLISNIFM